MAKSMRVTGERKLMSNINKEIGKIEGDIEGGILAAAKFIQAESQLLTPVDFGLLRNSAFSNVFRTAKSKILGIVGYTAKYAPWVHEAPMTLKGKPRKDFGTTSNHSNAGPQKPKSFGGGSGRGVYWQGGENKFLEKAVSRNTSTILNVIKKRAKR